MPPLRNSFGRKGDHTIYRIGLKQQPTVEETLAQQMRFERELRLWLKDANQYNLGIVDFVKRGRPDTDGSGAVIISTTPQKIAEIIEKFSDDIASIHVGRLEDVLTYKEQRYTPPKP